MDFNISLIEMIKEYPALRKLNSANLNLEKRRECWRQIAKKLQVQDNYLKIRWHSLVQRYQRDINFKYRNQMKFLEIEETPVKQNVPAITEPSSEISEFDINNSLTSTINHGGVPEITEPSVDVLEFDINEKGVISTLNNSTVPAIPEYFEEILEFDMNENGVISNTNKEIGCIFFEVSDQECNDIIHGDYTKINEGKCINDVTNNNNVKKLSYMTRKRRIEHEECYKKLDKTSHFQSNNKLLRGSITKPIINYSKKQTYENQERCEDVIFGELVTAMLKRMGEKEKRNVKKQIMNLLLA